MQTTDIFGNKVKRVELNSRTVHYVEWEEIDESDEEKYDEILKNVKTKIDKKTSIKAKYNIKV